MILTNDWMLSSCHGSNELTLSLTAFDGKRKSKVIPLSLHDFHLSVEAYKEGMYIQDAFPTLSANEREFILNGMDDLDIGEES